MNKEELIKKISRDLKYDKAMSLVSLVMFVPVFILWVYGTISFAVTGVLAINLLLWLNAAMLTRRNKQMMEVR